jgi:transcriptional regulator with XRE-family HTH domain
MIHEALRLIRVFHDLKQVELAGRLGVSKSHISEIEKGNKSPSLDLIQRYAAEFKIPVSSIMFFAEELPNAKSGDKIRSKIAGKVLDILHFVERKADAEDAA